MNIDIVSYIHTIDCPKKNNQSMSIFTYRYGQICVKLLRQCKKATLYTKNIKKLWQKRI
jgi:hypothetical protein